MEKKLTPMAEKSRKTSMEKPTQSDAEKPTKPKMGEPKPMKRMGTNAFLGMEEATDEYEAKLLVACTNSDIPTVTKMLQHSQNINFECIDLLGRTPLQLAVENEDIEVTKMLLPFSEKRNIEDCLLFALVDSNENLAMAMLRHDRYKEIQQPSNETQDSSVDDGLMALFNSKFPSATTPLILASEKNLYEVVRHFLVDGQTIEKPHSLDCYCTVCLQKRRSDQFRFAHERLNTYRGLASESYISLSSEDPILDAFKLRKTLLALSIKEEFFKAEYCELAKNLSEFSVKLLHKVIGDRELDVILNKVGESYEEKYSPLGRLKLAILLEEKKFVAHPSCQMRLKNRWYKGFPILHSGSFLKRAALILGFVLAYIFFAMVYLVAPKWKYIQFMRAPCAKFIAHTFFFLVLLAMLLWTTIVVSASGADVNILAPANVNITDYFPVDSTGAVLVRAGQAAPVHYCIFLWVVASVWQEIKEFYRDGWREYLSSVLNIIDVFMLTFYLVSFGFRFYAVSMVESARDFFQTYQYDSNLNNTLSPMELLTHQRPVAEGHYYWLNPDRYYWDVYDPVIIGEGLFAVANVLNFVRLANLLPAFEPLGTLQISFGMMLKDIVRFMGLFALVFLAFMIGLSNLYWFYNPTTRESVQLAAHTATTAENYFGDLLSTFKYLFWSLFGMGEIIAPEIDTFKPIYFTQVIGYLLYGTFMVCIVIILLNMLIAMMSLSYENVTENADVQWKFARTQLYFDYISPGGTLPIPLNIIPTPKAAFYCVLYLMSCCKRKVDKEGENVEDVVIANGASTTLGPMKHIRPELISKISELQKEELFKYKAVMSRIVRRFISDTNISKDDTQDADDIKQDLMRIRRELSNALELRSREIEQCRRDVNSAKEVFERDLGECKTTMDRVEKLLGVVTSFTSHATESRPKSGTTSRPGTSAGNASAGTFSTTAATIAALVPSSVTSTTSTTPGGPK